MLIDFITNAGILPYQDCGVAVDELIIYSNEYLSKFLNAVENREAYSVIIRLYYSAHY